MPAAHPKEFRDDVVAVARRGEAPIAQLAKDFGISESCLRNWLHQADVEDGHRPGVTKAENEELREARKKIRLLEQAPVLSRRVYPFTHPARPRDHHVWLRSLGGGVFAALRGGLVAAITQDWLQVGVAV